MARARPAAVVFAVLATGALARPARAGDGETYRGTMVIVDLASVGVVVAGAATEATPALALGVAGYALGSPIVHAAHGRWGAAGLAFGARVGIPAVAMVIGCGAGGSGGRGGFGQAMGCIGGGMLGVAVGVVAGVVIDYAVLAAVDDTTTPVMLSFGASF
ncbi:MAG: hypothetical protein IPL61_25835 [Myxococcales bacterium]|nr:hypothetical protein [Myxococcales bacterium]